MATEPVLIFGGFWVKKSLKCGKKDRQVHNIAIQNGDFLAKVLLGVANLLATLPIFFFKNFHKQRLLDQMIWAILTQRELHNELKRGKKKIKFQMRVWIVARLHQRLCFSNFCRSPPFQDLPIDFFQKILIVSFGANSALLSYQNGLFSAFQLNIVNRLARSWPFFTGYLYDCKLHQAAKTGKSLFTMSLPSLPTYYQIESRYTTRQVFQKLK